jgi:hypothetical protein
MSASSEFAESLARIEHKLDLVLKVQTIMLNVMRSTNGPIIIDQPQVGDPNHTCPVCAQPVTYGIDLGAGIVSRKCGCKTGKIAINLNDFAPPTQPRRPDVRTDPAEDGADAGSSGRGPRPPGPARR